MLTGCSKGSGPVESVIIRLRPVRMANHSAPKVNQLDLVPSKIKRNSLDRF